MANWLLRCVHHGMYTRHCRNGPAAASDRRCPFRSVWQSSRPPQCLGRPLPWPSCQRQGPYAPRPCKPHGNAGPKPCAHGAYQLGIHITARIRRHTSLSLNNMMAHPDCVACKILCQINLGIQFLLWESCYMPCQTTCDRIATLICCRRSAGGKQKEQS